MATKITPTDAPDESVVEELTPEAVAELIEELSQASDAYYQQGEDSPLSDEEFDSKLSYLEQLSEVQAYAKLFAPDSRGFLLLEGDPALGTKLSLDDDEIEHAAPMLSLGKAKKPEELLSYLRKAREAGAESFRLQAKLDGLAFSVVYSGGKVATVATRGTGTHGADSTYILDDSSVAVVGLPRELPVDSVLKDFEVRGELFFTTEQFQAADNHRLKLTGERFKNSRNAAAGLLKKAKDGVGYPVEFTFTAYALLVKNSPAELSELPASFVTVDSLTEDAAAGVAVSGLKTDEEVSASIAAFGVAMESFSFPTDGVVIKPTNESAMHAKMGYTSHHPASQVAWKYPEESATTQVLGIDLTVGKTGKITPIARVKPVLLDGSILQNASLHNFNLVYTKDIRVGSIIEIFKANKIIPQIKAVISQAADSELMPVPTQCPACKESLTSPEEEQIWPPKTLRCANALCPSRNFFALKSAVGKAHLDIDGLSEVSLEHLHEVGLVNSIADLYRLDEATLANSQLGVTKEGTPRRLGEKRAAHILSYIERSKTRPLSKMLPALSIELLGQGTARELQKAYSGDIDALLAASLQDLLNLESFGTIKAEKVYAGLQARRALIAEMRELGVTFGKIAAAAEEESGSVEENAAGEGSDLSGLSFAISGGVPAPFENRNSWVDFVEAAGGSFHSGPKADTSFMVGDPADTSAKIKKAHSLGVEFISPEEFTARFVE